MKGIVLISGGVDSAVAAYFLKRAGAAVTGLYLEMMGDSEATNAITSTQENQSKSSQKAERICRELNLDDFISLNVEKEFRETVIRNFKESYQTAITPNPCILCNRLFKFGKALDYAKSLCADYLCSGHYTKTEFSDSYKETLLRRGVDGSKDQSYFLSNIRKEALPFLKFPLGDFYKSEVRQIAEQLNLSVSHQADSQEICFVPNKRYGDFLRSQGMTFRSGKVLGLDGAVIGKHTGYQRYTIGQRSGMEYTKALSERLFVYRIDGTENTVTVAPYEQLFSNDLEIRDPNLYAVDFPFECLCQIRKKTRALPSHVYKEGNAHIRVHFETPIFAITPGQYAVFYDRNGFVLGSGVIKKPQQ